VLLGCRRRQVEEADPPIGARDGERAPGILDVGGRRFERGRGQILRLLDRPLRRHLDRRAADEERPRPRAAEARSAIGIALDDPDLLDRDVEHVDRELREGRREALPHRLRRRKDLDVAVGRDGDGDLLFEHVRAGPLEKRRHAASAQFPARRRLRARASNPFQSASASA
jgi:hypothetical protein